MALVRTFTLPHYEAYQVHVALFKDVTNGDFLRSQLLASNPDFDYAFLDASMILSPQHLLTATFLALHTSLTARSKTRTPHSELVFRLSPNNNIGESYKRFGISDTTTSIIAVKLSIATNHVDANTSLSRNGVRVDESVTAESVSKHLGEVVKGASVEIGEEGEELGEWVDAENVRKVYKLNNGSRERGGKRGEKGVIVSGKGNGGNAVKDEKKGMESVILGILALKGT